MAQERTHRPARPRGREAAQVRRPSGQASEAVNQIDDLLDEIDSVLEENAEEFVKNYVQKGGE